MPDQPLSGKGVLLRCTWCGKEERIDMGDAYPHKQEAELFLHLMTGGHSGSTPPDFAFRPTSGDDPPNPILEAEDLPQVGESACCRKPIAGKVYGYDP